MDSGDTTKQHLEASAAASRQFEEACRKFEQALSLGDLLTVDDLGPPIVRADRGRILRELLLREMEFRSKRGDAPTLEEYQERFPEDRQLVKYLYFEHFVPARLGEFSIQRLLGSGSFGLVYQGWDAKLSRPVALKVFRRDPDDAVRRGGDLLREARTAAQLRHPAVVTVYAVLSDDDGDEFLVLEYMDGKSLRDLLRSERISPRDAANLMVTVAQALQHAHQNGLVHRDLKPANILLDQNRRPRVTDFGLALDLSALRQWPEIAGTLPYMAPEQVGGETHRLDARTDLWAAGVILYQMLSGRLPFAAEGKAALFAAIRRAEPEDLLRLDPTIPAELARIVRRCLAKRMSDRYQSAAEFADDLRAFLAAGAGQFADRAASGESTELPVVVMPKGLRCFDAGDREFFLQLVPGPRDRHGVPQAIRFWEHRLQELDGNRTFRVGLLYGPSGCGKSSLGRAGILPQLPQRVRTVLIEATREETESALIREFRRQFRELPPDLSLPEIVRELREGRWLAPGEKLVIVLDQFEQWLHGWRQDEVAALVEMLRQCDGGRVQGLVMVRDDFWMPVTRFFQQLDVPLVEGSNAAAVDLFDRLHATKVLTAFGVSYGRVEADSAHRPFERQKFLEHAIDELAVDDWIVPVRLCIFCEMVKSRPWTLATLRDVGGTQGLGAAFLEDVFDSRTASPMHRLHRNAARSVLERLLPSGSADIRGHLVSENELLSASGYEGQPADFTSLMRCLDHELRLITPSDTQLVRTTGAASDPQEHASRRLYQLTHDFLVVAIRSWLNQTRQRTLRGRAELRLAEYADAYAVRQEGRQLPTWWEWLSMLLLTRWRKWQPAERTMMRHSTRRHVVRYGLVLVAAITLGSIIYDRMAATHTQQLVDALESTDSRGLPNMVEGLTNYRRRVRPLLAERLASLRPASDHRVRILAGLVAVGEPTPDELYTQFLNGEPPLAVAIADILRRYNRLDPLEAKLWDLAGNAEAPPGHRLRAGVALARLSAPSAPDRWRAVAEPLAGLLLGDLAVNPGHFETWVDALAPVRESLVEPLSQAFQGASTEGERLLAASILARYLADDKPQLSELALQSSPKQFRVLGKMLAKPGDALIADLLREAQTSIPADGSEEEKDRAALRKANAILLLHETGNDQYLWPALEHRPDPRLRSFLIRHVYTVPFPADEWKRRLAGEKDAGIRQALILMLGSPANAAKSPEQNAELSDTLLRIYRDDVDAGVHGAAQWTLRQLGSDALLEKAIHELSQLGVREGFRWYVTKSKLTMVIVGPVGPVQLGSPDTEPGRDESDEAVWTADVDWAFAISSTEVTQAQFREVCPTYEHAGNEYAPDEDCPVNAVSWLEAAQYCRLLSERDEIPESEMAVPAGDGVRFGTFPNFLQRTGYRLPTEAEWEVACRAGTVTPRFFGYAPDLLPLYSWYIGNSQARTWPVGQTLPNAAGLFDMMGNVCEWCLDVYSVHPQLRAGATGVTALKDCAVRGNDYSSSARMVRTANRRFEVTKSSGFSRGFRVAHTIRLKKSED
jgi:eukaryotic-like serine/threonine-protein kinase